jgi:hypothetical protein
VNERSYSKVHHCPRVSVNVELSDGRNVFC